MSIYSLEISLFIFESLCKVKYRLILRFLRKKQKIHFLIIFKKVNTTDGDVKEKEKWKQAEL